MRKDTSKDEKERSKVNEECTREQIGTPTDSPLDPLRRRDNDGLWNALMWFIPDFDHPTFQCPPNTQQRLLTVAFSSNNTSGGPFPFSLFVPSRKPRAVTALVFLLLAASVFIIATALLLACDAVDCFGHLSH